MNLGDKARLGRPISLNSEAVLQGIEANPASNIRRVSGKLGISKSSVVGHIYYLGKSTRSCPTVPLVTKILQNF